MTTIALPSVMSLLIQLRFDGTPLGTGTGFVILSPNGPVLITNRHNVTGRHQDTGPLAKHGGVSNELLIFHNTKDRLGHWTPRVEPLYAGEVPLWNEHQHLGPKADFVALRLTQTEGVHFYPYDLTNQANPQIPDIAVGPAEPISVVGFPFGLAAGGLLAVWATGFVASEPEIDFYNLPVFLIDCRSRPGQSGSAVIAYRGGGAVSLRNGDTSIFGGPVFTFLGIYSGRINDQSDLGIVWKASALNELVQCLK